MEFLIHIFNLVLYKPLLNLLVFLYEYLPGHDFGVAIIVLTILIRLLLYPLGTQAVKVQKAIQELQPKIQEIQKKYKDNKPEQVRLMMELYKKAKINPFSGLTPILIQLPILIALYRVFWRGIQPQNMVYLYSFIPRPEIIDPIFLGKVNLSQPALFLAICAGIAQYWQAKMVTPKAKKATQKNQLPQFSEIMQKQMLYFLPVFTVLILLKIPSAVALYWIVATLFSIFQQYFVLRERNRTA